jgi:glycosyltransferase involved in cell wall biosynthesis
VAADQRRAAPTQSGDAAAQAGRTRLAGLRVCIVTRGHLATCPRMVKAADALALAGCAVHVVSCSYVDWAVRADQSIRRRADGVWGWTAVDWHRRSAPLRYYATGVRQRAGMWASRIVSPDRLPTAVLRAARGRSSSEMVAAALTRPMDVVYGGGGALAEAAEIARRAGVPYALDLEDFHSAEEEPSPAAVRAAELTRAIERRILAGAGYLSAASPGIAEMYEETYGVRCDTIHNTFPLPPEPPGVETRSEGGLSLYWFSQTIGPGRGLEDAIRSMGQAQLAGVLHLRGRPAPGYMDALTGLRDAAAPELELSWHNPAPPDAMVDLARGHDVGLSLEEARVLNRDICLTNKVFTYLLAGLAVAMTGTTAQLRLAADLGDACLVYPPGDVTAFAEGLRRWDTDRELLRTAREAAWAAAARRWHWEHEEDMGRLLRGMQGCVGAAR